MVLNTKKISIIGGAGFVGSRLADLFDRHSLNYLICDINIKDRSDKITYLDVEDQNSLEKLEGSTVIINLAAVHRDDARPISRYDDVNVKGAVNVCNAARKLNIRKIVFTSSVAIYGFAPINTDEAGKPNFFNDYGRTKYLAEGVYKKWQAEDPLNRTLVIIRPTVIFGEGNRGNVYNLLNQIASRKFVMFGNGKNRKSMAYVENVAAFIRCSLSLGSGVHVYNYIDKPDFDMNTLVSVSRKILFNKNNVGLRLPGFFGIFIGYLADIAAKALKRSLPVSSIRVKKFMATSQFASSVSDTRFIPKISLQDGLEKTLRYEFIEDNSDKRTFDTE